MLRISAFFFSLLFLAACGSTKLPTSEQLSQMDYREVRGLFDVSESQEKPDKMPLYPKGNNGLITDIQSQVTYPQEAKENNEEGIVIVAFTITDKGELKKPKIDRGVSPALDQAALDVMETLKPWYPAEVNGEPSEVRLKVLVTFNKPVKEADQYFKE
jgi:protein TonB